MDVKENLRASSAHDSNFNFPPALIVSDILRKTGSSVLINSLASSTNALQLKPKTYPYIAVASLNSTFPSIGESTGGIFTSLIPPPTSFLLKTLSSGHRPNGCFQLRPFLDQKTQCTFKLTKAIPRVPALVPPRICVANAMRSIAIPAKIKSRTRLSQRWIQ